MRRLKWSIALGGGLLALSVGLFFLQVAAFHRTSDTIFYLLQDLAFLPVQVLLVTLVIDRLLTRREKRAILDKMNMVIGAFHAEVGTELLKRLIAFDANVSAIGTGLVVRNDWSPHRFADAIELIRRHTSKITVPKDGLEELRRFLLARRDFLLRLLENPNLLEHDTFTDTLWAVFHLTDELVHREDLKALPESDLRHLSSDSERAYKCVAVEWLAYLEHLKQAYPYLFSLATRTNPLDATAQVEVK